MPHIQSPIGSLPKTNPPPWKYTTSGLPAPAREAAVERYTRTGISPSADGTERSITSTPGGAAPSSHRVTALTGNFLDCTAMISASLMVATATWRLVNQPHTRSRRLIRAMAVPSVRFARHSHPRVALLTA